MVRRMARYLERQGLLERDAEHNYLVLNYSDEDPMDQLRLRCEDPESIRQCKRWLPAFFEMTVNGCQAVAFTLRHRTPPPA